MRIRIVHETRYTYERPLRSMIQILRMTPRPHDGLRILQWRIETDLDDPLRPGRDAFENVTHVLSTAAPISEFTLTVTGEVETIDTHAVLYGAPDPLPVAAFLRSTPLTVPDDAMIAFADKVAGHGETLDRLHTLLVALNGEVRFDADATGTTTSASEAFALRRGVCQDLSHIFIACARHFGVPARYVSGHLARSDGVTDQTASHAWAEACVPGLGWVGFDPTNGVCPADGHVRLACGFDYLDAAPVRGARTGGGSETMDVTLKVVESALAKQSAQSEV